MAVELDLTPLESAVDRLREGLERYEQETEDILVRDGLIQRFEFTYELSHRMLKRYLEMASPNPAEIDEMTFQTLIRTGNEQGVLRSSWDRWRDYRQARTNTSHTYDEQKALEVLEVVPDFLQEARHLLKALKKRAAE